MTSKCKFLCYSFIVKFYCPLALLNRSLLFLAIVIYTYIYIYKAKNLPFLIFFNKISIKYITLSLFYDINSYIASYCKKTRKTCRWYATHDMTVTMCERYATQLMTQMSHEVRAQSAVWSADMRADTPSLCKHFFIWDDGLSSVKNSSYSRLPNYLYFIIIRIFHLYNS